MSRNELWWDRARLANRLLAAGLGTILWVGGSRGALASVIYVDDSASANGSGLSWSSPFRYLSDATAFAAVPANGVTEIRVAGGIYRPDQSAASPGGTNDRSVSFPVLPGVALRGGYAGIGTQNPDLRDPVATPTILTGEIGSAAITDNSRTILRTSGIGSPSTVDGCVIRKGYANGIVNDASGTGAGLYLAGGSVTIVGCTIEDNTALDLYGAGVQVAAGNVQIIDCTLRNNAAPTLGGAGANVMGGAFLSVTGSSFVSNTGGGGGALRAVQSSTLSVSGCTFSGNIGGGIGGGAIFGEVASVSFAGAPSHFTGNSSGGDGGAIWLSNCPPASLVGATFTGNIGKNGGAVNGIHTLIDCTFVDNMTTTGGGGAAAGPSVVHGCAFTGNHATLSGGALALGGTIDVDDCVFTGNSADALGGNGGGGALVTIVNTTGTIRNCQFIQNHGGSSVAGGAALCEGFVRWSDCVFDGNTCDKVGGAMALRDGTRVERCTFVNNSCRRGGAVVFDQQNLVQPGPFLLDSTFIANSAPAPTGLGGAVAVTEFGEGFVFGCRFVANSSAVRGGAIWGDRTGAFTITNCFLSGNSSLDGGAIAIEHLGSQALVSFCTITSNHATVSGGGIHVKEATLPIRSSILWGNTAPVGSLLLKQVIGTFNGFGDTTFCCIQGAPTESVGAGDFGFDPGFVDLAGVDQVLGTDDDDPTISTVSPCLNVAPSWSVVSDIADLDLDGDVTEPLPIDFAHGLRLVGSGYDIGAVESPVLAGPGTFIGPSGGLWSDPSNWQGGAVPSAQTDVYLNRTVVLDRPGLARLVIIDGGGTLDAAGGSLAAEILLVNNLGTLRLRGGGALTVESLTVSSGGTLDWSDGALTIDGGTLDTAGSVVFGDDGDASLSLRDDALVRASAITIGETGTLRGNGLVESDISSAGRIEPGLSEIADGLGALTIDGSLSLLPESVVALQSAGFLATSVTDRLDVGDSLLLDGTLECDVLSAGSAELAERTLVTALTIAGSFTTVDLTAAPEPWLASVITSATSIDLGVTLAANRVFVKANAAPGGNGLSWDGAFASLDDAIAAAAGGAIDQIWVAEGSYLPTVMLDPSAPDPADSASFLLPAGVELYGGFAGDEVSLAERDPVAHPTVLTGDVLGNDGPGFTGRNDNLYHVVTCTTASDGASLDGFVIRGGTAQSFAPPHTRGGGVQVLGGSVTIRNSVIDGNSAESAGGGVAVSGPGQILLDGCTISGNRSLGFSRGGGVALLSGGQATVVSCTFGGNTGTRGGALSAAAGSAVEIHACTFLSNSATEFGGAIDVESSGLVLTSSHLELNNAQSGGALHALQVVAGTCSDTTFLKNTASAPLNGLGGALFLEASDITFVTCAFPQNSSTGAGGAARVSLASNATGPMFLGCSFTANFAGSDGVGASGAIDAVGTVAGEEQSLRCIGCVLSGNFAAGPGGAIGSTASRVTIRDCAITGNTAASASGALLDGATVGTGTSGPSADLLVIRGDIAPMADPDLAGAAFRAPGGCSIQSTAAGQPGRFLAHLAVSGGSLVSDRLDGGSASVTVSGSYLGLATAPFAPAPGSTADFVTGGTVSGDFVVAYLPATDNGAALTLSHSGSIALTATPSPIDVWSNPSVLSLGSSPLNAAKADFDLDGDMDLAVTMSGNPGKVVLVKNLGIDRQGGWLGYALEGTINVGTAPATILIGQFTADGYPDIVVGDHDIWSIRTLSNQGAAGGGFSFTQTQNLSLTGKPLTLVAAQVVGSAALDLLQASNLATARVFQGSGNGTFTVGSAVSTVQAPRASTLVQTTAGPRLVVVGGDGSPGNPPRMSIHTLSGGIGTASFLTLPGTPNGVVAAELDGIPGEDLLITSVAPVPGEDATPIAAGSLLLLPSSGGAFSSIYQLPALANPGHLAMADMNGDGLMDVSYVGDGSIPSTRTVRTLLRRPSSTPTLVLQPSVDLPIVGSSAALILDRQDGDLRSDVIVPAAPFGLLTSWRHPAVTAIVGDPNGDGLWDAQDLAILLGAWGTSDPVADLDQSGEVDATDLAILLAAWS
jgi:predicted outer membrane repeat protein